MKKILVAVAFLAAVIADANSQPVTQPPGKTVEKRLTYVEGNVPKLTLAPKDVVQVQPFNYPLVPDFSQATLKVEITDDNVVGFIGSTHTPPTDREGRGAQSAFLYARTPGKTKVKITLVNNRKKDFHGYTVDYEVEVGNK
jgi:hypothetical protein